MVQHCWGYSFHTHFDGVNEHLTLHVMTESHQTKKAKDANMWRCCTIFRPTSSPSFYQLKHPPPKKKIYTPYPHPHQNHQKNNPSQKTSKWAVIISPLSFGDQNCPVIFRFFVICRAIRIHIKQPGWLMECHDCGFWSLLNAQIFCFWMSWTFNHNKQKPWSNTKSTSHEPSGTSQKLPAGPFNPPPPCGKVHLIMNHFAHIDCSCLSSQPSWRPETDLGDPDFRSGKRPRNKKRHVFFSHQRVTQHSKDP